MRNYQHSKQLILNFILEERSTSALSLKLGYSFDKVKRWQNGSKQFRWNEFCDLCALTKTPLAEALASSFGILTAKKKGAYKVVSHLKHFLRIKSANVLAKTIGVSPSVMQRYLLATTFPDIEIVFELMDQRSQFLDLFFDNLLSPKNTTPNKNKSLISIPWAAAVANAASLKPHLHLDVFSAKWIADFTGLSEEQVNQAIDLLLQLKLIKKKGCHYGPTLSRTIGILRKDDQTDYANFIRYWMRRAELRFATPDGKPLNHNEGPNKDAFRIFSASPESAQKISDVMLKAEQEIHDILQQDTNEKNDVRVLLIHHFSAQDFKR